MKPTDTWRDITEYRYSRGRPQRWWATDLGDWKLIVGEKDIGLPNVPEWVMFLGDKRMTLGPLSSVSEDEAKEGALEFALSWLTCAALETKIKLATYDA